MDDIPGYFIPPMPTFPRSSPSSEETGLQALHMPFHPIHSLQVPTLGSQDILPSGIPHPSCTNFSPPDDPSSGHVSFSEEWEPRGYPVLEEDQVHLPRGDHITLQSAVEAEHIIRPGAPLLGVDQRMSSGLHHDIPIRVVEGPHSSVPIDPQCHAADLQTQTTCVEQNPSRFTHPYDPILEPSQSPSMARKPADLPPTSVSPASPPTDASLSRQTLASPGVIRASQNRRRKEAKFQCNCGQTFTTKKGLHNHELFHRDIRRYKCQRCTKAFVTKHDCTRHEKRCGQTRS